MMADGRREPDGGEVAKGDDHAGGLELVHGAEEKVGYEERAIGACALYNERKNNGGELDEEVDGMGVGGRVEDDGKEVDKPAEGLVEDR